MKFLFVDDSEELLEIYQFEMEDTFPDVEAHFANSAKKAIELCMKNSYEVIATDGKMPGMDGIEFLREIKSQKLQSSQIYLITGFHNSTDEKELCDELNIDEILIKPFDFSELALKIKAKLK